MTFAPDSSGRRREPRFQVINPEILSVSIERKGGKPETLSAVLMDLSRGGLRLSTTQSLPQGEEVRLSINVKDIDVQIHTHAKVCWSSPGARGGWFVGCTFLKRIAPESITELATRNALERRRDVRRTISFSAVAKTELGPDFATVRVVNFSGGGFCALATKPVAVVGERLMVRLPTEDASNPSIIRAKVAWVNTLEDGQAIGCTFFARDDYVQMQTTVGPESRGGWVETIKRNRPTNWGIVVAALMVMLAAQLFHITQSRPDLVRHFDQKVLRHFEPWLNP